MDKPEIIHLIDLKPAVIDELAAVLMPVVADGASIGFLAPITLEESRSYWKSVPGTGIQIFLARINGQIAGTVQLHLCMKANGQHRAEVAKLMVLPEFRRHGIARLLMAALEKAAQKEGRTLLVLDTREGDPSNHLYRSMGYLEAGRIPKFARSSEGGLDATVFYYKELLNNG